MLIIICNNAKYNNNFIQNSKSCTLKDKVKLHVFTRVEKQ